MSEDATLPRGTITMDYANLCWILSIDHFVIDAYKLFDRFRPRRAMPVKFDSSHYVPSLRANNRKAT